MALKAVSVMVLYLLSTCAAKQNCSEIQCKLLPVDEDVASEFQAIKNSKNGVRMIYMNLLIGNDSYDPLELQDEFLSDRWVWAATISELMLSLSYDYDHDILSLGLLKRQVRRMDVQLRDEPSGCLAGLNSSCQNIVVGQALLGNVTSDGSSKHVSEDVVCVAEIDTSFNFFDNFFDGDVEFRCCKGVSQSKLPKCELSVEKSNWFMAFYAVLNVLTIFVGVYSPAFLFLVPDYIFDVRKECKKEEQQEQEEEEEKQRQRKKMESEMQQTGFAYEPIPSSQEMHDAIEEEGLDVTYDSTEEWVMLSLKPPATPTETNNTNANEPNANEPMVNDSNQSNDPNSNESSSKKPNAVTSETMNNEDAKEKDVEEKGKLNELPLHEISVRPPATPTEANNTSANEPNASEPIVNEPNQSNDPNSNESNSKKPNAVMSETMNNEDAKDKDEEEKRKVNELPLDDGSPFNVSTLLYTCKSAEVFRDHSTKLSFNIKLAFLWFCVCPVFFYIELALGYTLKDEFFDEIAKKDKAFLVGGFFSLFDMTDLNNLVILIISYFVIPLLVILILRPKDLNEKRKDGSLYSTQLQA